MEKYIIKDLINNAYYLGDADWTICRLCAKQYKTIQEAKAETHYIKKVCKPIKIKELKIIEIKGE